MSDTGNRMDLLARAIRAWLERDAAGAVESRADFLARHADLRELLEPMLDDAAAGQPVPLATPAARQLGDYRLIRELGRGGMGVVYEAQQLSLPRRVALKVLGAHLTLRPDAVARFRAEAVTAARLEHPGIVKILAQGAVDEAHFFAMELVQGAPLQSVLDRLREQGAAQLDGNSLAAAVAAETSRGFPAAIAGPAPGKVMRSHAEAAIDLVLQVADALEYGHRHAVIHRDVKPANILVRTDGSAVLTDFGLARDQDMPGMTASGTFAGTPHYTSPEQADGRRQAIDARTDVFSLGVTLYELTTLQRPFGGETSQQVLSAILTHEPRSPEALVATVPLDLAAIVLKALEKEPKRRYQSAAEFADDLRRFLAHQPVVARRASTFERLRRWRRREPVKAALVAMLAVAGPVLTAGAGYLFARRDEIAAGQAQLLARQVSEHVEQGFLDFAFEEPGLGIPRFEAALALNPQCAEAQLGLLQSLIRRDGPDVALARLERDLAPHMTPAFADLMHAAVYCRLCRGDEAQAAYSRLPEPRTELELFLRGTLDRDLNKDASARSLEYFERAALAAGAPHLWVHINWATFAESEGDEASCRRCAANLLLNWPDDPIAIYFAALALHRTQPERAAQLVQQALQQHPEIGLLHCAEGMLLRARGEPKAAIAAFERAVARSPRLATLHYSLGAARYDTGDTAGAIAAFTAARDLTPRFAEAWIGLGMALRRAGRLEESRAALQEAAQLNGSSADARFQYGQTLVLMDRIREGAVALKAAVELRAKDPNQWHHLANALFRIGDDEGGFQALRGAVTVAPTNERAHHLLVLGLRQTGQATAARAAVKAWVEALPQSLDGWLQFGLDCIDPALADDQRDAPGGIWAARRALSISAEQSALAWYVLGAAEALLGHTDPARDALQRSLDAKETPLSEPERSRCAERLRELGGPRAASLGK